MTNGEVHRQGALPYPNWVPTEVCHYLGHTEAGQSIRALARRAGCHASTILRQVRRIENRRDDPLLDEAFERLAGAVCGRKTFLSKGHSDMIAQQHSPSVPDTDKIEAEARRILRRLAEPDACLAIAPKMEKAVVVRETADGRTVRTGVVDREIAEAFAVKDWIALRKDGKVARYGISPTGRAALKRLLAERETAPPGFAEAQAPFASQHRIWGERDVEQGEARPGKRVRYNAIESPLAAVARRRDKNGKPFLGDALVAAGERLREDFELAQMGPRVAQNWDRFLTGGDRGGYRDTGAVGQMARAIASRGPSAIWGRGWVMWSCAVAASWRAWNRPKNAWAGRRGLAKSY